MTPLQPLVVCVFDNSDTVKTKLEKGNTNSIELKRRKELERLLDLFSYLFCIQVYVVSNI